MEERLYDLIFIARPATPEDEIKKVISGIEHTCAEKGGKIEKTEHWGTRKLAYRVAKHREGMYVYQQIRTSHAVPCNRYRFSSTNKSSKLRSKMTSAPRFTAGRTISL